MNLYFVVRTDYSKVTAKKRLWQVMSAAFTDRKKAEDWKEFLEYDAKKNKKKQAFAVAQV